MNEIACPGCGRKMGTQHYDRFLRDIREYGIQAMVFEHPKTDAEPTTICVVDPSSQAGLAFIASVTALVERN